jgi:hypothetical protein
MSEKNDYMIWNARNPTAFENDIFVDKLDTEIGDG